MAETPKYKFKFEIVTHSGQRIVYNYPGESSQVIEQYLHECVPNAKSIRLLAKLVVKDDPKKKR